MNEETLILTPSALFDVLSQIEELKGHEIQVEQNDEGIYIKIDENKYNLQPGTELSDVDDEIVDVIEDINEDGYEAIDNSEEYSDEEPVEGGIIKELIKTLAIGGLVRLTKNALTN